MPKKKKSDIENFFKEQFPKMWLIKTSIRFSEEFSAIKKGTKKQRNMVRAEIPKGKYK